MNANAVAKNYGRLTSEERFRLILAASGRGDQAERDRLARAGHRITLSMPDYSPCAHAFKEITLLTFIELLEEAARYLEAFDWADDTRDVFGGDDDEEDEGAEVEEDEGDDAEEEPTAESSEDDAGERPAWQRNLDLALASGFMLKTRADGWKLFCERLNVLPFLLWECLPGSDRLQRALALAEKAAFTPGGFLRWLNTVRPAGEPERTEMPLTAERMADATMKMFRERVDWWGG
jgi:hypothetical protein